MLRHLYFDRKSRNLERELFIDAVTLPSRAVLLDVDGTILDLAPTPVDVVVPAVWTVALERLSTRVVGALAPLLREATTLEAKGECIVNAVGDGLLSIEAAGPRSECWLTTLAPRASS